ncbi:immunoglobulin domain-containing protein [Haloferula sp. A504]|uniref:immunoglobulin domain-containing protein n=1 Tax=Haloferula sp. A504 TaxID=3373601 RepID=UPI0031C33DD3|nr:hypothetical protein [Verrucomicrobiaceae bacterium E54]
MKTIHCLMSGGVVASFLFAAAAFLPGSAETIPYLLESEPPSTSPDTFIWATDPGVRYDLWESGDLDDWQRVDGFPMEATGLSMEYAFTPDTRKFFRIESLDEQPPLVAGQYPAVDGFAVGRFADITVKLEDATGIDPATIQLTVGALGTFAESSTELTFAAETITFDSGGDTALGGWGETITATLVVDDTLGNRLTHTWSFRLEPEPQAAEGIFVFGSPTAQRAGQRVVGPAAALASRFPAPAGPQRANDPPPWEIDEVLADRIVITYEAGGAPAFSDGQLICNLAPATESEIFYRRVLSTTDDAANLELTVMTEDADLTEFLPQGAVAFSPDSVVYETGADGTLVRALSVDGEVTFPRVGYDLSGTSLALREDGFEFTLADLATVSVGDDPDFLTVTADEWFWWLTPRLNVALETQGFGVKSFEAIASGQVSTALALDISALLVGAKTETTLFDLPEASEPKHVVLIGVVPIPIPPFGIPVYGVLGFDFLVKSEAEAQVLLESGFAWRQEFNASFGVDYTQAEGLEWIRSFQASAPDIEPTTLDLTGEFDLKLILEPRLEFLVYGLAGMRASIEPSGGLHTWASTSGDYGGQLEADLDFVLGTAGLLPEAELSLNVWHDEWPLTDQELVFKTQPSSQTVAPNAGVSFTCAMDAPSPPSFQWFHNGSPIPGQTSRSLFLPRVNAGHAGGYFVRATVDRTSPLEDLIADSEVATLTVQEEAPKNVDSDGDGVPDIHETNTGVWVSDTDRGTNPYRWDSDGDGLSDGAETNTRSYVSRGDTGTDPNEWDTDGDGVNDKREIDLGRDPSSDLTPVAESFPDAIGDVSVGSFPALDVRSVTVIVDDWRQRITFKIELEGDVFDLGWGKYCIGIRSSNGGDTAGSAWERPISMPSGMTHWIGSWVDTGGWAGVWAYQDGNWGAAPSGAANTQANISINGKTVAISTSLGSLGLSLGETFQFDVYTTSGGGGDSAADALSISTPSVTSWLEPYASVAPADFTIPNP